MSVAEHALMALMQLAARETPDFVSFETGAPAMRTRFYAEEAAAAVLAATGVLAADLWRSRGGGAQTVTASTREAAAALTSFSHIQFADPDQKPAMAGPGGAPGRTPANGFFPTKDGRWVFLHPSFPSSAAKLHEIVGAPADREAAARNVLDWAALDLENAIAKAGVCGAMVRTPDEWDTSQQGRILAARPVVEVTQIGESAPEPLPSAGHAPLSGVRVLDLTRVLAGPTCARTLAQYGADVLYLASPNLPSTAGFVADTNHGKLSAWLDLDAPEGPAQLAELVRTADVFSQGYRAGALERRGFGPLELAKLRPGLVYIAINAYGHEGPWRNRPGWEQLAQTVTGMAHVHGGYANPEGHPQLQPGAVTDYTTGFLAAFGAMIALQRRARHGGSYMVRVSLSQTGMWVRGLGLNDRLDAVEPLTPDEVDGWRIESETGFGVMRHLRPAVRLSETPGEWRRPVVRLGTHPAAWP